MSAQPYISCIMPTANRGRFVQMAINYFLRQDYTNSELIIIDDGEQSVSSLIPANDRIKYFRINKARLVIGVKRNFACQIAKGEIIMHWDDDDWYASDWISYQVNLMLSSNADIVGLSQLYFHNPGICKTWKYIYPANEKPWVAGATMAYRKAFWQRNPFLNVQVGEDNQFVWFSGGKVISTSYINGFVSILHSRNTSPKYINDSRWVPNLSTDIMRIMKDDFLLY